MSMICYLTSLTPAQISTFTGAPELVSAYVENALETGINDPLEAKLAKGPPEMLKQYLAAKHSLAATMKSAAEPGRPPSPLDRLGPFQPLLDLQKSWHVLHYLLTGRMDTSGSLGDFLLTGDPIGDDQGYGPARLHSPAQTSAISGFLAPITAETLVKRLDLKRMTDQGVYPMTPYDERAGLDGWDMDISDTFPRLKDCIDVAAARGDGLLIWLS